MWPPLLLKKQILYIYNTHTLCLSINLKSKPCLKNWGVRRKKQIRWVRKADLQLAQYPWIPKVTTVDSFRNPKHNQPRWIFLTKVVNSQGFDFNYFRLPTTAWWCWSPAFLWTGLFWVPTQIFLISRNVRSSLGDFTPPQKKKNKEHRQTVENPHHSASFFTRKHTQIDE